MAGPLLISVRVPDSVGFCRAIGLDLERWLAEDLIDMLVVGGYFRLQPWEESVALGHRYGVPVYAGLSESRVGKRAREDPRFHGVVPGASDERVERRGRRGVRL